MKLLLLEVKNVQILGIPHHLTFLKKIFLKNIYKHSTIKLQFAYYLILSATACYQCIHYIVYRQSCVLDVVGNEKALDLYREEF